MLGMARPPHTLREPGMPHPSQVDAHPSEDSYIGMVTVRGRRRGHGLLQPQVIPCGLPFPGCNGGHPFSATFSAQFPRFFRYADG
eukprot:4873167-Prorocentrum_lima.AAC.1